MSAAGVKTIDSKHLAIMLYSHVSEKIAAKKFSGTKESLVEQVGVFLESVGVTITDEMASEFIDDALALSRRGATLAAPAVFSSPAAVSAVPPPSAVAASGRFMKMLQAARESLTRTTGTDPAGTNCPFNPETRKFTKGTRPSADQKYFTGTLCWPGTPVPYRFVLSSRFIAQAELEAEFGPMTEVEKNLSAKSAPTTLGTSPALGGAAAVISAAPFDEAKARAKMAGREGDFYNAGTGLGNKVNLLTQLREGVVIHVPGLHFNIFCPTKKISSPEQMAKGIAAREWLLAHGGIEGVLVGGSLTFTPVRTADPPAAEERGVELTDDADE